MDNKSEKDNFSRRRFIKKSLYGIGGTSLGLLSLQTLACTATKSAEKPNILLIVADDAGWHDVGYHDSEIKTPTIDKLAKTGVELDQFYVSPTCSPTRASLLTGRYASRFGILGPIAGNSKKVLPVDAPTIASVLRDNGYATAITGKWHLGLRPENGPHKYGFEYTYGYLHGQIDQYTHVYKYGDNTWHRNNERIDQEGHATDLITNEAMQYIKNYRDKTKPFMLYVPYSVPHHPLQEEEKWTDMYKDSIENESRRKFAASVTHMDTAISQLLKTLDDEKLRDNTLVIFFSDNGGQENWLNVSDKYEGKFGPYDRLGDNTPLRDYKASLYEGGIRVPAIFNWPAKLKPAKVNALTSVNDIFQTVVAITGSKVASGAKTESMNIWNTVADGKSPAERELYWRTPGQYALRKGDWKIVFNGADLNEGTAELFNLATDPYEKQNLAEQNKDILAELMQELKKQAQLDDLS